MARQILHIPAQQRSVMVGGARMPQKKLRVAAYEMEGVFFQDAKAVVFDLAKAKEMEPFRSTGQKKTK